MNQPVAGVNGTSIRPALCGGVSPSLEPDVPAF